MHANQAVGRLLDTPEALNYWMTQALLLAVLLRLKVLKATMVWGLTA